MTLPNNEIISKDSPLVLKQLNDNLKTIRELSHTHQQQLVQKRDNSTSVPSTKNKYKPGEFVLFEFSVLGKQLQKLDAKYLGPYKVISHIHNDVTVRNLISDAVSVYHSNRLKPFYGSQLEAYEAAKRDSEQYEIDHFIAYRGDPLIRKSMEFYIKFSDGCHHWKVWNTDLFDTIQYELYCKSLPQLSPLVTNKKESDILIKAINSTPITAVGPNTPIFLDLRAIGAGWYEALNLPDNDFTTYVVEGKYTAWNNSNHTSIQLVIPSLDLYWTKRNSVNGFFVKSWGSNIQLTTDMVLVDQNMIQKYKIKESLK